MPIKFWKSFLLQNLQSVFENKSTKRALKVLSLTVTSFKRWAQVRRNYMYEENTQCFNIMKFVIIIIGHCVRSKALQFTISLPKPKFPQLLRLYFYEKATHCCVLWNHCVRTTKGVTLRKLPNFITPRVPPMYSRTHREFPLCVLAKQKYYITAIDWPHQEASKTLRLTYNQTADERFES